jgi:site-specific DNA-methyltransferase (adenine-specific)
MTFLRKEIIGDATLYLGDCRDILPTLGPVDLVFTSPPYNLGNTSGGGMPGKKLGHYARNAGMAKRGGQGKWSGGALAHGYGLHDDAMPHATYVEWQHGLLWDCWSLLSERGAIFYNHKPRVLDGVLVTPLEYNPGLPVRQVVIWARAGGVNFSPAFYLPTHEWVVILAKPAFRLRDKAASGAGDVWYIPQEADAEHPAPFPVALPMRAIETTKPGLVLDPFMGRGSTGMACARLGRPFVGIELEPRYFDIACRRITEAYRQPRLFEEPPPKPVQDKLFGDAA